VEIERAMKYINKQICQFEEAAYYFEMVAMPRYETDKKVLESLRQQYLKLDSFKQKVDAGESVTQSDVHDCVPEQFR
jgi:hypothetical protein